VEAGKTLCLVGEKRLGKERHGASIAKLVPAPPARYAGGEILLEGRDVMKMSSRELCNMRGGLVSYVFQEPGASLNPVFRIGAQIKESLKTTGPRRADDAEVIRLLKLVGIPAPESRLKNYPHEMSGGMQQRVMIAMALASQPKLLVADEPTTALDVTIQAQIIELLGRLRRQLGMAVLLITHNLGIVGDLADDVAVMYAGQIVERARCAKFSNAAASLHAGPDPVRARIGIRVERLTAIPGTVPLPGDFPGGCRFHPRCPKAESSCSTQSPELIGVPNGREVRCPLWNSHVTTQTTSLRA